MTINDRLAEIEARATVAARCFDPGPARDVAIDDIPRLVAALRVAVEGKTFAELDRIEAALRGEVR